MMAYQNSVIVKTDKMFNDKVSFRGVGGREVVLDPSFDPQKHVRTYAEVVSVPLHLTKRPIMQEHRGTPAPTDGSPFEYRYLSDVKQEVKVGDRVYYHFNSLAMRNCVKEEGTHPNRIWYFKISYEQIICAVRDGKIIPIASYVLVLPDYETWDDILHPTYTNLRDAEGKLIPKPKDQWIQTKVKPEYHFLTAHVKYVGSPLGKDTCEVQEGQKIWYRRNADWINMIEGVEYFAVRQRHIIGKEVDGKFVPIRGHMLVTPEEEPTLTESGIKLKEQRPLRGFVVHSGDSPYSVGTKVEFGQSDRQELILEGSKFLVIKKGDVWATHQRTATPNN
jgi:co-chaperonin GroES (HSP10)